MWKKKILCFHSTCVLVSLGQLCCKVQAEITLKPLTTIESGNSDARYSALDSGYWFILRLLLTSTRILPASQKDTHKIVVKLLHILNGLLLAILLSKL